MFKTSNFLLTGLFAGLLYLGISGLRKKQNLKALLSPAEGQLLFGSWGSSWRERLGEGLFLAALGSNLLQNILLRSQLRELYPDGVALLDRLLDAVFVLGILGKILLGTRYDLRQLSVGFCCFFVLRWVHFNSHNIFFITSVLLILAAKDVPWKHWLRVFVWVTGIGVGLIMLCSLGGIAGLTVRITQHYDYGSNYFSNTFGFTHWNALGGFLFGLSLGWVLLRENALSWLDYLGLAALSGFTLLLVDSKTSGLLIFLVLLCCLTVRFFPALTEQKWAAGLAASLSALMAAISIGITAYVGKLTIFVEWPPLLKRMDELLTGRLRLQADAWAKYPIRIAGQFAMEYPPVDNCYLNILLFQGPVVFLLLWGSIALLLRQLFRTKKSLYGLMVLATCAYALMEMIFLQINVNPTLLLLSGMIWGCGLSEENK